MSYPRIKKPTDDVRGPNYNYQHFVFTTKYRNEVFDNSHIIEIAREAFYHAAAAHNLRIKVLSFGDDHAHVHLEVDVPVTITVADAVQYLKGYASFVLFKEMPSLRTDYFWGGEFWGRHYGSGSVGPADEKTVQNYITRQDITEQVAQCSCQYCNQLRCVT